jgi:peptidoglycan-N-acetylglucosamine deacetylase
MASRETKAAVDAPETGKSPLRRLIPLPLRLALNEMSPGRRRSWRRFSGLERLPEGGATVALTFDDGPGELTAELLELLGHHRLRATFFLLGEEARRRPDAARAVVAAGHEVGVHGFEHFRHDRSDAARSARDVRRAIEELEAVCAMRPRWYRPPFGRFSPASFEACAQAGLRPAYWSVWGYDWEPIGAQRIVRRINRGLEPGAVLLLHDSARYAERDSARATLEAVPLLAVELRERGLETVTLSEAPSPAGAPATNA